MSKTNERQTDLTGLTHIEEAVDVYVPRIMLLTEGDFLERILAREARGEGYELDSPASFSEAMKMLKEKTYRLVFCDMTLNGESSIPFIAYCAARHKNTYVISIATKTEMRFAIEAMKSGANHVLARPINLNELLIHLREGLKAPRVPLTPETGLPLPSGCELIKEIGKGNVCTVYLVKRDGVELAMKIPNDASWGVERLKRFFREADILAKISHSNVVRLYEYGVSDNEEIPYIIMEYLPGGTLETRLNGSMIEIDEALSILAQLLSALTEIHGHGLLHRDIKPKNILFSENKTPKLLDFGLVKTIDSALTMTNAVLGTPAYMAPEGFDGTRKMDERSDIFSVGVIAYEMLTGSHPFQGGDMSEIARSIKNDSPPSPSKLNPKILSNLRTILAGMLAKAPEDRYHSAEEALTDVENFRRLKYDFTPRRRFDAPRRKKNIWRN